MLTDTQAREALGIPVKDSRVDFETDWDGREFKESECLTGGCRHGYPVTAAVHIDWTCPAYDPDTDVPNRLTVEQDAYCFAHAKAALVSILDETAPFAHDDNVYIRVVVNGWYLRYAQPAQVAA